MVLRHWAQRPPKPFYRVSGFLTSGSGFGDHRRGARAQLTTSAHLTSDFLTCYMPELISTTVLHLEVLVFSSELVQSDLLSMISTAECAKNLGWCVCMMAFAMQPCGHSIHSVSLALAVRGHSGFLFCLNYCFSFGLYRIRRSSA